MKCRIACAACCIEPSISESIPGMPNGKPAGVPCIHLSDDYLCKLFGKPERPQTCRNFKAEKIFCGDTNEEAFSILSALERSLSSLNQSE